MKTKLCFVILSLLSASCARINDGEVGFWFDPRAKEFQERQAQKKQLEQDQVDRRAKLEQQQQAQQETNRVRQAQEQERQEEQRREFEEHQKRMRELQEKAEQDRQRQYEENQIRRRACLDYKNNHCHVVSTPQCVPVKQCQSVNGTIVCWNQQQCSTNAQLRCTGEAPDGCDPQNLIR